MCCMVIILMICSSPALPILSAILIRGMSFSLKALSALGAPTIMAAVSPSPDNKRTSRLLPACLPVTFPLMAWRFMSEVTASIGTAEDVAERLKVSKDWVWDHSSRRLPHLPVIRMSDGTLRYRSSQIEEFVMERERVSRLHRRSR